MPALQSLINLCNGLTIDRRKLVGVQYTRSQLPRTELTPTKNPWRFSMEIPAQPWYQMRPILEELNTLDRYQPEVVTFSNAANMAWMFRYQGTNAGQLTNTPPTGMTVTSFNGNQLVLGNIPARTVGDILIAAGDLIQIAGSPYPFTSTTNIVYTAAMASATVTTHRPNIITLGVAGNTVIVGNTSQFNLFCPGLPNYKLTPAAYVRHATLGVINFAMVEFDGPLELYEWVSGA